MPVTLRLAFRNLFEHRSKSLIIGILLGVGALVLVVGNSFIDASKQGIRNAFTENYTGDVFISGISADGPVSLFGVTSVGGLAATPVIPEYERVRQIVSEQTGITKSTGLATGFGIVSRGDIPRPEDTAEEEEDFDPSSRLLFMFGIDATQYWKVFDTIEIVSGSTLTPGQIGIVINEAQREKLEKWLGIPLGVGDSVTVQGVSSAGMKLREIPIVGTYRQKEEGASPEQMSFVDIDTIRVMAGMTVGANEAIQLDEAQTAMLQTDDFESLFSDAILEEATIGAGFDEIQLQAQLADTSARMAANTADSGAWQFIVARTRNGQDSSVIVKALNKRFAEEGLAVKAGDWQMAAGPYGQSVDVIRIVFTIAIAILSIVAVIIITNTFVISVIERTGEIGTMRAIGADRGFIRKLFAAETMVLSLVFSFVGAMAALGVVGLLNALKIEAGNPFLRILFGGSRLSPFVTPANFLSAIAAMVVVGYLAHLYPVSVALKIQPVRAMQQE